MGGLVVGAVVLRVADLLVQLALIGVGLAILLAEDPDHTVDALALWCLIGGVYWLASVIAVAISVRRSEIAAPRWLGRLDLHPAVAVVSVVATFLASTVGLVAATEILILRDDPNWAGWVEPVAISAMLLSWALYHWGFARIYHRRYRIAKPPPLVFPGTAAPRIADFVYFSFTNATNFSVSDVQVMTTRMRWTVVWHTVTSFFLNALIIVLAFSTIING
ncbi:DUF1345 domain-containing protein [Microbacterium atlanticum]|uniref:DUF1345 domain-containing protein n=1 Tax=Microbacterium atlanticum TaxID=2782168 RepID=UPI001889102F|nr:DUF1345 domain-containing protein [Microbacterium atlanticum]